MLREYFELVRFSHSVFALPFALLAAAMALQANAADTPPVELRWQELLGIVLCMITARTAASSIASQSKRRCGPSGPFHGVREAGRATCASERKPGLCFVILAPSVRDSFILLTS